MIETISASEFKAKCLNILDRLAKHEPDRVVITKRRQPVGVLTASEPEAAFKLYRCMRGSVVIPESFDLTEPVCDESLDAELGVLHQCPLKQHLPGSCWTHARW